MKAILITTLVSGLALAPAVFANDAHHPDKDRPAMSAASPSGQLPADQTASLMQENVKRMQEQLENVRRAKDPAERERLLAEHQQTMRENMALGHSMMQGGNAGMGGQGGMGMMGGQGGMGMMGAQGGMGMMGAQGGMGMMGGMHGAAAAPSGEGTK